MASLVTSNEVVLEKKMSLPIRGSGYHFEFQINLKNNTSWGPLEEHLKTGLGV